MVMVFVFEIAFFCEGRQGKSNMSSENSPVPYQYFSKIKIDFNAARKQHEFVRHKDCFFSNYDTKPTTVEEPLRIARSDNYFLLRTQ